jgi:hypothetical protein
MSEKWMEFLKWTITNVVIVVITLIVDNVIKYRESDLKEMEAYDKYVEYILVADNIEKRWNLCCYFSIVTPSDRLRNRWIQYKNSIEPEYRLWKKKQNSMESSKIIGGKIFDSIPFRDSDGPLVDKLIK